MERDYTLMNKDIPLLSFHIKDYISYGGYSPDKRTNEGLLEVLNENTKEIRGRLTAEDVIRMLKDTQDEVIS